MTERTALDLARITAKNWIEASQTALVKAMRELEDGQLVATFRDAAPYLRAGIRGAVATQFLRIVDSGESDSDLRKKVQAALQHKALTMGDPTEALGQLYARFEVEAWADLLDRWPE